MHSAHELEAEQQLWEAAVASDEEHAMAPQWREDVVSKTAQNSRSSQAYRVGAADF